MGFGFNSGLCLFFLLVEIFSNKKKGNQSDSDMLALERHRKILYSLSARGSVRTTELATEFDVTEETIRRDFEKLEGEGQLVRTHGGAATLEFSHKDSPLRERIEQNAGGKARIARAALRHVREGGTVFFDASTTVLQLAALLPDRPLTVVTNALQTALTLAEKSNIAVFLLGGKLGSSSLSCTGWAAAQGIAQHRIDTAFLSCKGLDGARGASEATEEQAWIKRDLIARASEVILLADRTKVGLSSNFFYSTISGIDLLITDEPLSPDALQSISAQGARVEVADK
jgi:DeoR/GlpR family transcriptional regulator of sugar metabolism